MHEQGANVAAALVEGSLDPRERAVVLFALDRAGPAERVLHGKSGFVSNDADDMADYVVQLAKDPDLQQRMGDCARQLAQSYDVMHWVDEIERGIQKTFSDGLE